jgi:hypothetical protein
MGLGFSARVMSVRWVGSKPREAMTDYSLDDADRRGV